jgi:CxxC motif-containing protein
MGNNFERKLICIRCPRGCEIQTSIDGHGAITSITGNFCKLGDDYSRSELSDPRRTVTSTVRIKNSTGSLLPVWTDRPVPKDKISGLMEMIRTVEIEAPVSSGQVILKNIFGMGIDVLASKSMAKTAD